MLLILALALLWGSATAQAPAMGLVEAEDGVVLAKLGQSCGGLSSPCYLYQCYDGPWPGLRCGPGLFCSRQSAALHTCVRRPAPAKWQQVPALGTQVPSGTAATSSAAAPTKKDTAAIVPAAKPAVPVKPASVRAPNNTLASPSLAAAAAAGPKPANSKPAGLVAERAGSAEVPAGPSKPAGLEPIAAPGSTKPGNAKPGVAASAEPAAVKPAVTKPAATLPAAVKPAVIKPAANLPAAVKPAVTKPAATLPAAAIPAGAVPEDMTEPTGAEPENITKPAAAKPAGAKPTAPAAKPGALKPELMLPGTISPLAAANTTVLPAMPKAPNLGPLVPKGGVKPFDAPFQPKGNPDVAAGQWISGRATFYGAGKQFSQAFEPYRGEGAFGVIEYGSCGYTQSDGSLPYPIDGYAAPADTNADYPGSCGRCYQIRCRTGLVYDRGEPVKISSQFYMPGADPLVKDDQGRSFPGNPWESEGLLGTRCWDDSQAITLRIGDSCPCMQKLPSGEVRPQFWCCGGNNHFDISYWAFQKLAHPLYGAMSIEYRPVDCATNKPLDPLPGFVNQTIYGDDLGAGWGWRTYNAKNTKLLARGEGLGGGNATCVTASQNGAVPFFCRECSKPGYQPFAKANYLSFWVRSNTKSLDPFASSTPPGQLPELKVFLMNDEGKLYCGNEVVLGVNQQPTQEKGAWYRFDIPLSAFNCGPGSSMKGLQNVDRVDFMNTKLRDANFCLDDIVLSKTAGNSRAGGNAGNEGGNALANELRGH